MAQEIIEIGTAPNDGTGDALRTAFSKAKSNFTELYEDKADAASVTAALSGKAATTDSRFRPVGAFSAHKNGTSQTGISSATYTAVTFGTEVFDDGAFFASDKWTPPAGRALIAAQLYVTGTFAVGSLQVLALYKNGGSIKEGFVYAPSANVTIIPLTAIVDADGDDQFEIRFYGTASSGTLTISGDSKWTFFTERWFNPRSLTSAPFINPTSSSWRSRNGR